MMAEVAVVVVIRNHNRKQIDRLGRRLTSVMIVGSLLSDDRTGNSVACMVRVYRV